ncbi:hypothetical protein [Roseomonas sp. AR75]|uniref:hypothetical protein n=1 Tax=Roseomonas sp. AR75 TaxID=2562311 RepID=UPI0010C09CCF|nr:hypothetical protein [Roseomonas sp. AR75]
MNTAEWIRSVVTLNLGGISILAAMALFVGVVFGEFVEDASGRPPFSVNQQDSDSRNAEREHNPSSDEHIPQILEQEADSFLLVRSIGDALAVRVMLHANVLENEASRLFEKGEVIIARNLYGDAVLLGRHLFQHAVSPGVAFSGQKDVVRVLHAWARQEAAFSYYQNSTRRLQETMTEIRAIGRLSGDSEREREILRIFRAERPWDLVTEIAVRRDLAEILLQQKEYFHALIQINGLLTTLRQLSTFDGYRGAIIFSLGEAADLLARMPNQDDVNVSAVRNVYRGMVGDMQNSSDR